MVKRILHIEGLALFLFSLFAYNALGGNWLLFIVLLFTPDISMVGYLWNKKIGSVVYNLVHNYVITIVLVTVGNVTPYDWMITLGIILFAHVSMDRALGFGLKYSSNFKDTHIQKLYS